MIDPKQALEELLAASREAAQALEHAFKVAVGENNARYGLAPLERFREAIEKAERALEE